jgi:hypothetical protein
MIRQHPGLLTRRTRLVRLSLATVLAAVLGCNSHERTIPTASAETTAASPSTRPAMLALNPAQRREVEQMRKAVEYLASDALEGRGVETDGLDKAAQFIAREFRRDGLKRLPGASDYFQPFTINLSAEVGERTQLTAGDRSFTLNEDFTPMGLSAEGSFAGPVAFVGYSIANDEFKYDDFTKVDVKGKVALALRYEPMDDKGASRFDPNGRSDHASFTSKAKAAAERGAVALLIVNPPVAPPPPPPAASVSPGEPPDPTRTGTTMPTPTNDDGLVTLRRSGGEKATIPVLHITRETANQILRAGRAKDLEALQTAIDKSGQPKSFLIDGVSTSGNVELKREKRELRNVMAYVPGTGPAKDEYLVVGAHYDHLGRGETGTMSRLNRDQIHNGADDNASGTVAMLQLAERVAKDPLERSVIFIAFSGEERGLLGSAHFVNNPSVPLDKIVAMVNLDMVGRLQGDAIQVGGTGTAEQFEDIVERIDQRTPIDVKVAGAMVGGKGGLGPSDHASFAQKKIPVMFLWTGNHPDYHRPTDDADKVNYAGMAHVVEMTHGLLAELAVMPKAQYVDRFDRSMRMSGSGIRVRLGIMPDYAFEDGGVRVGSTFPETPAAKAGIKDGDVIVEIAGTKIATLDDYMTTLNKQKPGDTIKIGVMRKGERVELEATLGAPRRG